MVCGVTAIACTLFDVLAGMDEVKLCTGYRLADGTVTDRFTPDARSISNVEPIYETFSGWPGFIDQPEDRASLHENARKYLDRIEEFTGVPIEIVSVGPERSEVLVEA
jgi:adenylosuccinate synthase